MNYRIAAKGLLEVDGRILFIEYAETKRTYYALPGGQQEAGESMMACLQREFREELNLEVEAGSLLFVDEVFLKPGEAAGWPDGMHLTILVFRVRAKDLNTIRLGDQPDLYMQGYQWLSRQELDALEYYPDRDLFAWAEKGYTGVYRLKE